MQVNFFKYLGKALLAITKGNSYSLEKTQNQKTIFSLFFFSVLPLLGNCQILDSLGISVGSTATIATNHYQPLWIIANRYGTITDQKADISSHLRLSNKHTWNIPIKKPTNSRKAGKNNKFYIEYGFDLFNNHLLKKTFLQEAYVKADFNYWELRAGRYEEKIGEMDKDLSSGSLGTSGNALPIPKISGTITRYIPLPFTNGWLEFKGQLSHGWMGRHQYLKDAFLHEKNFYMRLGKGKLKLFGGVQHYAVWGGRAPQDTLELDRSLAGYVNVLFAAEANDGSVPKGIRPNRAGDHRGVVEGGIDWENDQMLLHLYHQTPFDMGQGITFRNIDKLLGISFNNKSSEYILNKLLVEFIYTKQMNNFYPPQHRESYYNNGMYATGWEYKDNIIGTPLFINRVRGNKYFEEITPFNWNNSRSLTPGNANIINNRIIGGHIGVTCSLSLAISSKTLLTYTRNFGTYGPSPFRPYKDQLYCMQQLSYKTPLNGVAITTSIGFDHGQLSRNIGMLLGIEWKLLYKEVK